MKHGRLTESQAVEQLQQQIASRRMREEAAVQKWSRASNIAGLDLINLYESNPAKARRVAQAIQNQENALKNMSEATVSTAFGTSVRPENLLKVVYIGTANSCRGDIFTEVQLATTDDALFYVDMTYDTTKRGATAGNKIYESISQFYASEQYYGALGTGDGSTTAFVSAAMSPLPLVPWSVKIISNGAIVAQDNGMGVLVGPLLNASLTNTIDYNTGVATVNFTAAPATGAVMQVYFNWSSGNQDNISELGKVNISLTKKRFNARPMPLGYSFTDMTQVMFETTGLGSAREYLDKAIGDEHAKSRDYRAIGLARQIANGNAIATFNADFAAVGEVSRKSHAQSLLHEITKVGGTIYDDIKRGSINKIVAGSKALSYMKLHDLWTDDKTQPRTGVYKAGTLSDIEVFACPADASLVNNNDILMTYKNEQEGMDVGLAFGNLTELSAELRYPTMYTEGQLATVEDALVINPKFIRRMSISNI
jgi:hypothetical protein